MLLFDEQQESNEAKNGSESYQETTELEKLVIRFFLQKQLVDLRSM
jgi:hypothetical protein